MWFCVEVLCSDSNWQFRYGFLDNSTTVQKEWNIGLIIYWTFIFHNMCYVYCPKEEKPNIGPQAVHAAPIAHAPRTTLPPCFTTQPTTPLITMMLPTSLVCMHPTITTSMPSSTTAVLLMLLSQLRSAPCLWNRLWDHQGSATPIWSQSDSPPPATDTTSTTSASPSLSWCTASSWRRSASPCWPTSPTRPLS